MQFGPTFRTWRPPHIGKAGVEVQWLPWCSVLGGEGAARLRIFFQLLEVGFRPLNTTGHGPGPV